jgi:hypothetical protein
MKDSCRPRKLDPGFEVKYSNPRDLKTSTMKSDPVRSVVCKETSCGSSANRGAPPFWGAPRLGFATSAAAPPAAIFRNALRPAGTFFAFAMKLSVSVVCPALKFAALSPFPQGDAAMLAGSFRSCQSILLRIWG